MTCQENHEFLSVGCDWLTATYCERKEAIRAATKSASLLRSEVSRGCFRKPWGMSGFTGWKAGSIQYGRRGDELIVRLGGHLAHTNWRYFYEMASNVSRLDIECTSRTTQEADRRIRGHWKQATRFNIGRARPPRVGIYINNDKSATLYLGCRQSDRFGRIYDKGRESKLDHFRNAVRYEVEFKNRSALSMAQALAESRSESLEVAGYVAGFFQKRGVVLPPGWAPGHHLGEARSRSDADRRLSWLAASVRGSVSLLVSMGRRDEVLEALGLSSLLTDAVQRQERVQKEVRKSEHQESDNHSIILRPKVSERSTLRRP